MRSWESVARSQVAAGTDSHGRMDHRGETDYRPFVTKTLIPECQKGWPDAASGPTAPCRNADLDSLGHERDARRRGRLLPYPGHLVPGMRRRRHRAAAFVLDETLPSPSDRRPLCSGRAERGRALSFRACRSADGDLGGPCRHGRCRRDHGARSVPRGRPWRGSGRVEWLASTHRPESATTIDDSDASREPVEKVPMARLRGRPADGAGGAGSGPGRARPALADATSAIRILSGRHPTGRVPFLWTGPPAPWSLPDRFPSQPASLRRCH
jgi:hypothetical protein